MHNRETEPPQSSANVLLKEFQFKREGTKVIKQSWMAQML